MDLGFIHPNLKQIVDPLAMNFQRKKYLEIFTSRALREFIPSIIILCLT